LADVSASFAEPCRCALAEALKLIAQEPPSST
jgi:hypothetical protein